MSRQLVHDDAGIRSRMTVDPARPDAAAHQKPESAGEDLAGPAVGEAGPGPERGHERRNQYGLGRAERDQKGEGQNGHRRRPGLPSDHRQAIQRLPGHGFGQKQARKAAERKQGNQREDHDDLAGMAPERRYQLAADHPSVPGALPEAR